MAKITRVGKPDMTTFGDLPKVGEMAPPCTLTNTNLDDIDIFRNYAGKNIIISMYPSADTSTCASSIRKLNEASDLPNTVVLCVSMDLPFALKRFCGSELSNVIPLSAFRNPLFGEHYGVSIIDGYLRGLFARAVVAINPEGRVIYSELVEELTKQPNYDAVFASVRAAAIGAESKARAEGSRLDLAAAFTAASTAASTAVGTVASAAVGIAASSARGDMAAESGHGPVLRLSAAASLPTSTSASGNSEAARVTPSSLRLTPGGLGALKAWP